MEIHDIQLNGTSYDSEYEFHNQALTLVFREKDLERTVRANLRYYPTKNIWDLNPIFYEFTDNEKEDLIQKILSSDKVRTSFNGSSTIQ